MRPGFWMHENAMDVCIEIIKVQYGDQKRTKFKVRWWNLGYTGNPWLIPYPDQFARPSVLELQNKDFSKWHNITHKMHTPRKASGLPA